MKKPSKNHLTKQLKYIVGEKRKERKRIHEKKENKEKYIVGEKIKEIKKIHHKKEKK